MVNLAFFFTQNKTKEIALPCDDFYNVNNFSL